MMISTSDIYQRQPFEEKALVYFAEVIINKSLIHEAGFGARAIPTYVGEWILSRYIEDGELSHQSRTNVAKFIVSYLPAKGQKDTIKDALLRQETVKLLDDYSVSVNLKTGIRQLRVPFLDMNDAFR
jgi:ATP-dependent Lon protease